MRRKKVFLSLAMAISLALSAVTFASAADYRFSGTEETEYYPDTSYEDQYRAEYKYGGTNLIDYEIPELPYGSKYSVEVGAMQKVGYPSERIINLTGAEDISSKLLPRIAEPAVFTNTAGMYLADGTIGEIAIPVLGISFKVREGETSANMNKGFAHYSSTSAWDGNVGVCGHNRGTKFAIGNVMSIDGTEGLVALQRGTGIIEYTPTENFVDYSSNAVDYNFVITEATTEAKTEAPKEPKTEAPKEPATTAPSGPAASGIDTSFALPAARAYSGANTAEVAGVDGDAVIIHCYDDMGDHTATVNWLTIDPTDYTGYDFYGNYVDLKQYK